MSYSNTPRRSPRKLGKGVPSPSQKNEPPNTHKHWAREHEELLLEVLMILQEKGVRSPYGKDVIPRISKKFNKRLVDGSSYLESQVSRKIGLFRDLHKDYSQLINQQHGTGYGWNDDMKMVVLSEDQWEHFRAV
jgi:hypothetical protein